MGSPVAPLTPSVVGTEAVLGAEWPRLSSDFLELSLHVQLRAAPTEPLCLSARRS